MAKAIRGSAKPSDPRMAGINPMKPTVEQNEVHGRAVQNAVDSAHAAFAELGDDAVVGDGLLRAHGLDGLHVRWSGPFRRPAQSGRANGILQHVVGYHRAAGAK